MGAGAALLTPALSGCAVTSGGLGDVGGTSVGATRRELPSSITEAGKALRSGAYTSEELTRAYLRAIAELQPRLNAFITITADEAVEHARRLDRELRAGKIGRAHV